MSTVQRVKQGHTGIIQNALPPYQFECWGCGKSWEPKPSRNGHTDYSLQRSADEHFKTCRR